MTNLADLIPAGGGQNNTDFVADGGITSGKPVILTAAGKAAEITGSASVVGTASVFESATTTNQQACFDSSNNKVVMVYRDDGNSYYGTVAIGTVDGSANTITWGSTPVVFTSNSAMRYAPVFDSSNNMVVISFKNDGLGSYLYSIVGTVSGTGASATITFGTEVQVDSNNTVDSVSSCFDTTNNRVVVSWQRSDYATGAYTGNSIVGTVSGTGTGATITYGTKTAFQVGAIYYTQTVYDPDTNKVVVLWSVGGVGTANVATVSTGPDAIAFASPVIWAAGASHHALNNGACYDTGSNKVVITYADQDNSNQGTALVGTVTTGPDTMTFGTAIVFESGNTSAGSGENIVTEYDPDNNWTVVAYKNASESDHGQFLALTVSGTNISAGGVTTFQGGTGVVWVGGTYDTSANRTVLGYPDSDNSSYGTGVVVIPGETNLTSTNLLGIASGAILDTATGTINTWGSRNQVQTSLTIGSDYYVQIDGTISTTSTSPAQLIGQAITATQINIKDYTG